MHRTIAASATAFLLVTSGCYSHQPADDLESRTESSPHAVVHVSPTVATIDFRVAERETWQWYSVHTPTDALEYEWQVYIGEPQAPRHSLGFLLFKHPETVPTAGTFAQLLAAGQVNLWSIDEGLGRVHGASVDASVVDDRLRIRLQNEAVIDEVFGSRPRTVTLNVRSPGAPPQRSEVPVQYRNQ